MIRIETHFKIGLNISTFILEMKILWNVAGHRQRMICINNINMYT